MEKLTSVPLKDEHVEPSTSSKGFFWKEQKQNFLYGMSAMFWISCFIFIFLPLLGFISFLFDLFCVFPQYSAVFFCFFLQKDWIDSYLF